MQHHSHQYSLCNKILSFCTLVPENTFLIGAAAGERSDLTGERIPHGLPIPVSVPNLTSSKSVAQTPSSHLSAAG